MEIFDRLMPGPNQIDRPSDDLDITASDLLQAPTGQITESGLKQNVAVGLGYVEAWLRGIGCVPLFNLMEDAATAEISRAQLWQWVHHGAHLDDGRPVTLQLCEGVIQDELARIQPLVDGSRYEYYEKASALIRNLIASPTFPEFLTLSAYASVIAAEAGSQLK
jgi:malate synthase